ncbi:6-carboxy-5,6,7,8-tetrahydropterin synthase [Caballeronia glebae]|uniref:6-carboxy-5,6,7,8-tetrahydropterin synthase n=1 Tax=Caballeronia glebae TaxID=1777143 RepID=A0A158CZS2_9BURK|nr:6-carboxytetrahydropterin synthase [Caballeronia glebae]SAK87868.1 6-carboxy-5,6,7,8-tetrahydropterin synthase [Caballeronia glebae]
MNYELSQKFYFEAAHTLHREIDQEGSRRIHGHTYHAEVYLRGLPDSKTGMLVDLGLLRLEIERIRDLLDHRFLDEVSGLGPATLENLSGFILRKLAEYVPSITKVKVERHATGDACVAFAD